MHFLFYTILSLVLSLLLKSSNGDGEISCDYVKFNVDLEYYSYTISTLGTFSLSTNRCQSLRAHVDLEVYDTVVDGSMIFTCTSDSKSLTIKYYDDATCSDFSDSWTVNVNDSTKVSDYLVFHIDELHCDQIDCEVGFTFAQNCSWLSSDLYLNVSLPPEQCLSFGADFTGISSSLPDEVLPDDIVEVCDYVCLCLWSVFFFAFFVTFL